jgi:1-acyl-sn-glycerol-3-phosphate acyltransferase
VKSGLSLSSQEILYNLCWSRLRFPLSLRDYHTFYRADMRFLYGLIFKFAGWRIIGSFPPALKKYIIAIAPHTSNWDFVVGIAARSLLRIQKTKFLGKSQLSRPPYGWLFRLLGGYPVERSSRHDMVKQVAELFNNHERFVLAIAPEGTRKKVERLRTGFYYIAQAANIPVIPVGFDYEKKTVVIGDPIYASDNIQNDFEKLYSFYRRITGKNPDLGVHGINAKAS